jgi:hypothetical protein
MITRLEPAAIVSLELMRKISKASFDKENEWYFYDGAYTATLMEHNLLNTWTNENFAIILGDTIIGYIELNAYKARIVDAQSKKFLGRCIVAL